MTREAIEYFKFQRKIFCDDHLKICPKDSIAYQATLKEKEFYDMAIKALEQEPCRDMEEIAEVINCDADAETKCKMISNILTAKPHYFEEREPILDKIRKEIKVMTSNRGFLSCSVDYIHEEIDNVFDKYKSESEDK